MIIEKINFKSESRMLLRKSFIFVIFAVVLFVFYSQPRLKIDLNFINESNKYLIYRCNADCGGWADRLKGIFSAYYWALLTDRQLVIEMNQPCSLLNLLRPNKINWNIDIKRTLDYSEIVLSKMQDNKFKLYLREANLFELYANYTAIVLQANRNYAWSFSENKHVQAKLKSLGFANTSKIDMKYSFYSVYSKLFKLSPRLDRIFKRFVRHAKPTKHSKLLCIHIRTGDVNSNGVAVNKHMNFARVENARYFWQFTRRKLIPSLKLKDKYKIFISSNSEQVIKSGIREFGKDNVVYYELTGSTTYHIDFMQTNQVCTASAEKTILDFHTFQVCDGTLLTKNSQYGMFASLNRPELPKLFYVENEKVTDIKFNII